MKAVVNEEGINSLLIMGTELQDTACYKCAATNTCGQAMFEVNLRVAQRDVSIPPKFVQVFHNTHVKEADGVNLHCQAVGKPTPAMLWQKDGMKIEANPPKLEINTSEGDSTLTITGIAPRDAGWYQCTAQNASGSVATRAKVSVESTFQQPRAEPVRLQISKSHRVFEPQIEKFETVTLRHVQKVYEMTRDEVVDSVGYKQQSYGQQQLVQQAQQCSQLPNRSPVFKSNLRDVCVGVGETAHFEAHLSLEDYSDLVVEWYCDERKVDKEDSRMVMTSRYGYVALTIMNVTADDSGLVTCRASNAFGESVTSGRLRCADVDDLPEYFEKFENVEDSEFYRHRREVEESYQRVAPNFVRPIESNVIVSEGFSVVLEAQVTPVNDASLRVEWAVDGRPISQSRKYQPKLNFGYASLTMHNLEAGDAGIYTAKAINPAGVAICTSEVKVTSGKGKYPQCKDHNC